MRETSGERHSIVSRPRVMGFCGGVKPAPAAGLLCKEHNCHKWEQIKRGGDRPILNWIDSQVATRSCVIVLVGAHTAERTWIRYEIRKAWNDHKGLLAIHIDQLLDRHRRASRKGMNPFSTIRLTNGERMDKYVPAYEPPWWLDSRGVYKYIADNLEQWVEHAYDTRHLR